MTTRRKFLTTGALGVCAAGASVLETSALEVSAVVGVCALDVSAVQASAPVLRRRAVLASTAVLTSPSSTHAPLTPASEPGPPHVSVRPGPRPAERRGPG